MLGIKPSTISTIIKVQATRLMTHTLTHPSAKSQKQSKQKCLKREGNPTFAVPGHSLGSFNGSSPSSIPHDLTPYFPLGMTILFKIGFFTTFTLPSASEFSSSSEHVTSLFNSLPRFSVVYTSQLYGCCLCMPMVLKFQRTEESPRDTNGKCRLLSPNPRDFDSVTLD